MPTWSVSTLLLAGAFVLAGCGQSSSDTTGSLTGRTDNVAAAYNAALAGLDARYFDGMEMSSPIMRQVLLVRDGGSDQMMAEWEGELAAGAAAARLTHPTRLTYVDVFEHEVGRAVPSEAQYGYSVKRHLVPATHDSDSDIEERVMTVLRDFHLTPTSVRVLHPLGQALVVEATADDPASVEGRMGELEIALGGSDAGGLDGMFVAVDGPGGPLFHGESAARIAEGGQWFAPGFDSGIPHG